MKIIVLAPLWERVPPPKYGGSELVVYNLVEGLVKRGHKVTLFAAGDSKTSARLRYVYPKALYHAGVSWEEAYHHLIALTRAFELAKSEKFDIIHNHIPYYGIVYAPLSPVPLVHTIHSILHEFSTPGKEACYDAFPKINYVSISDNQRKGKPNLHYVATVYNGIEVDKFTFSGKPGKYLAWLGRFVDKKGPMEAIKVAKKTRIPLIMAAKIDRVDIEYYNKVVKPEIDGKLIKYIGEIGHEQKNKMLREALCLLNPVKWEEPFGLVVPEANATGTPVIAFKRGAMPELIKDGLNGYLVQNTDQMAVKVKQVEKISRAACRSNVEQNFSNDVMVEGYLEVYKKLIQNK